MLTRYHARLAARLRWGFRDQGHHGAVLLAQILVADTHHVLSGDGLVPRRLLEHLAVVPENGLVVTDPFTLVAVRLQIENEVGLQLVLRLLQLFVLPEHQGRGIGSEVLATVLDEARRAGLPVALQVLKSNPRAKAFYERHGFAVAGETETHHTLETTGTRGGEMSADTVPGGAGR